MLFLRGASRPLGLGWLYFHLLLCSHLVPNGGELCRSWTFGARLAARPFRCPRPQDSPDAKFCCGSCKQPVCCASIEARLHPAQCRVDQQPKGLPATTPQAKTAKTPVWVIVVILALTFAVPFGCALKQLLCYGLRRLRQWFESRNGHGPNRPPAPPRRRSSVSDLFPDFNDGPPPYDSVFPDGPPSLLPTNGLPAAQQGQVNDGLEEGESPPGPNCPTDLDLAAEGLSPGAPGRDPPPSDANEAFGPRRRRAATVEDIPSRDNPASGLDAPPSYASLSLVAAWTLARTLRGNPSAQFGHGGPSRSSTVASILVPEEPPPSYDAAMSVGPEALPAALDHLPAVQPLAQPRTRGSWFHWRLLLWVLLLWFQLLVLVLLMKIFPPWRLA